MIGVMPAPWDVTVPPLLCGPAVTTIAHISDVHFGRLNAPVAAGLRGPAAVGRAWWWSAAI